MLMPSTTDNRNSCKIWRCPSSFLLFVLACGFFHHSLILAGGFCLSSASKMSHSQHPPPAVEELQQQQQQKDEIPAAAAAPLYITIGPPCAGKSTWIRHNGQPPPRSTDAAGTTTTGADDVCDKPKPTMIRDIALDDQADVWNPIPTAYFLQNDGITRSSSPPTSAKEDEKMDSNNLCGSIKFGQTIGTRIQKDEEMRLIAQRCAEQLSPQEFGSALSSLYNRLKGAPCHILPTVLECYECVLKQHKEATFAATKVTAQENKTEVEVEVSERPQQQQQQQQQEETSQKLYPAMTDLYVSEAIFRPHPVLNQSGLESALNALSNTPLDQPVAWGNTNTQTRDYKEPLQIAARQGRPVHFVLYNAMSDIENYNKNTTSSVTTTTTNSNSHPDAAVNVPSELQSIGFKGLLRNNLRRYLETGRYLPARALWLMIERTARLAESVVRQWKKQEVTATSSSSSTNVPSTLNGGSHAKATMSKFERDQALARLAGMEMRDNRTIAPPTTTLRHSRQGRPDNDNRGDRFKRHRGMSPGNNGGRGGGGSRHGGYRQQQQPRYQQQRQQFHDESSQHRGGPPRDFYTGPNRDGGRPPPPQRSEQGYDNNFGSRQDTSYHDRQAPRYYNDGPPVGDWREPGGRGGGGGRPPQRNDSRDDPYNQKRQRRW